MSSTFQAVTRAVVSLLRLAASRLRPVKTAMLILTALLVPLTVTACSEPQQSSPGDMTAVTPVEVCDAIRSAPVKQGAATTVVVVDRTASNGPSGTPPAVGTELAAAQKSGSTLTLVGVNGRGAAPTTLPTIALDPMPGVESVTAAEARQAALGCLPRWIQSPDLASTATGSDILAALVKAADQKPREVVVLSDGVANAGSLDLVALGWDAAPTPVASGLKRSRDLPHLRGVRVVWAGLGQTATPVPQSVRENLTDLWRAVITASRGELAVSTPTAPVEAGISATTSQHADKMPATVIPAPVTASCLRVPSGLLFKPDSAKVEDPSVLEPVVSALRDHPDWKILVAGHTADYGTAAAQLRFSRQRADAVAAALQEAGLPGSNRVATVGYGASRPAQKEWRQGRHDEAAAAANRRVEVAYGPTMPKNTSDCD